MEAHFRMKVKRETRKNEMNRLDDHINKSLKCLFHHVLTLGNFGVPSVIEGCHRLDDQTNTLLTGLFYHATLGSFDLP